MQVREVCRESGRACAPNTSIAEASRRMAEEEGAALPVVDDAGKLLGLVRAGDLLQLLNLSGHCAEDVPVRPAVLPMPYSCQMTDEIREALRTMRLKRIRSLPVVDGAGILQGMLSLEDLALAAKAEEMASPSDISDEDVLLAMKMIYGRKAKDKTLLPADRPVAWL